MKPDHPLREWRRAQSPPLTLEAFAEHAGVVPSHLSMIEKGLREPSLALASQLSEITGIPIEQFVRPPAAPSEPATKQDAA